MAKAAPETILLTGEVNRFEFPAGGTVTPGDLVDIDSSGDVIVHATAEGRCTRIFAVENDIGGDDITHDYLITELVQVQVCRQGDQVLATLANGENAVIGSWLVSAGDGTLQVALADSTIELSGSIVGRALEAKDMSGSTGVDPDPRFKVLVM